VGGGPNEGTGGTVGRFEVAGSTDAGGRSGGRGAGDVGPPQATANARVNGANPEQKRERMGTYIH